MIWIIVILWVLGAIESYTNVTLTERLIIRARMRIFMDIFFHVMWPIHAALTIYAVIYYRTTKKIPFESKCEAEND